MAHVFSQLVGGGRVKDTLNPLPPNSHHMPLCNLHQVALWLGSSCVLMSIGRELHGQGAPTEWGNAVEVPIEDPKE